MYIEHLGSIRLFIDKTIVSHPAVLDFDVVDALDYLNIFYK